MGELSSRAVLVTGAGGFIGSHLAARLVEEGANVRGLLRYNSRHDRGALEWVPGDIAREIDLSFGDLRDPESARAAVVGCELVFHLAAQISIPYSYVNPRDFVETNVVGSLNIAQAVREAGVERMVHTSTSEVYGNAQTFPIRESHPVRPASPYAASKAGADMLMDSMHHAYGLPVVTVRPFNTYGPHQSRRAIVPTVLTQAIRGDRLRLGSLHPRRDLTFVSDTVAGFIAAATAAGAVGQTVQLGTGADVSVAEIVELAGELVGRTLVVEEDPARVRPPDSEVDRLVSDPSAAAELFGWQPQLTLTDGLRATLEWLEGSGMAERSDEYAT